MPDVELRAGHRRDGGQPDLAQSLDHKTVRTQRELEMTEKRVKKCTQYLEKS